MTYAPSPTWRQLWSARHAPPDDRELTAAWCRAGDVAGLLSRSTWSLALIAEWRRRRHPERPVEVWLPAFFCESALPALRATGARLAFYAVDDALRPETDSLSGLAARGGRPDLLIVVHYFGQPAPTAGLHDLAVRHGAWLIEDAAHVLRPIDGVGHHGDFVLYSPHKLLAIPDGGVLVARPNGPARFGAEGLASFGEPTSWADHVAGVASAIGVTRHREWRWAGKRIAQRLGVRLPAGVPAFHEPDAPAPAAPLVEPSASGLARRLLASQAADLDVIARHRLGRLWQHVGAACGGGDAVAPADAAWPPYQAAFAPEDPAATFAAWHRRGWPVSTWPDLPPEVHADRATHAAAWRLRHARVYLAVHASLSERAVARARPLAPVRPATVRWGHLDRAAWSRHLEAAGPSSLLQDWAYGEAKAAETGWRVVRAAFERDGRTVAIAQGFEKVLAPGLTLRRVNRAPVMAPDHVAADVDAVWAAVAQWGRLAGGGVLAIAPEVEDSGPGVHRLAASGFRWRPRAPWTSIWLDLGLAEAERRRGLAKEWRNPLASAERAGLEVTADPGDAAFDWLMGQYATLMREHAFAGPSVSLLTALRRFAPGQLMVWRAHLDGAPVAGVLVARHGAAATYLVGWSGPEGRRTRASHLLLWQAMRALAGEGVRWFDAGGISETDTPGITAFKRGLGGREYRLVGEYLRW